jgi:ATP-dependent Zn protease
MPPLDPATAYHEAGHAAVAMALGRPVRKISILPNRDRLGWCEFHKGVQRPSEDSLEREMLIALAGMAAEARHTGTYSRAEAGRDLSYARKLAIERAGERKAERLESRMLAKVENLLGDETIWQVVVALSVELLKHGTISGRAAEHVYREVERRLERSH